MSMEIQWTHLDTQGTQMLPLPHTLRQREKTVVLTSKHNRFLVLKTKEEIIANPKKEDVVLSLKNVL